MIMITVMVLVLVRIGSGTILKLVARVLLGNYGCRFGAQVFTLGSRSS